MNTKKNIVILTLVCVSLATSFSFANAQYYPSSQIYFSQNNISVELGQNTTVTLYGGYNNSYYVSSNSSLIGTGINGNVLSIYANADGSTNLTICSYNSNSSCGNLYITIYGNPYYQYQYPISLSQNNIYMNAGQNQSVSINGNGYYYISNISNQSVAGASINNSVLNIYANNSGNTSITVCQNTGGSCAVLYVSVANSRRPHPIFRRMRNFFRMQN